MGGLQFADGAGEEGASCEYPAKENISGSKFGVLDAESTQLRENSVK